VKQAIYERRRRNRQRQAEPKSKTAHPEHRAATNNQEVKAGSA